MQGVEKFRHFTKILKGVKMKRYYFHLRNADEVIIDRISVIANSLESAKEKIAYKLSLIKNPRLMEKLHFTFDFHEKIKE